MGASPSAFCTAACQEPVDPALPRRGLYRPRGSDWSMGRDAKSEALMVLGRPSRADMAYRWGDALAAPLQSASPVVDATRHHGASPDHLATFDSRPLEEEGGQPSPQATPVAAQQRLSPVAEQVSTPSPPSPQASPQASPRSSPQAKHGLVQTMVEKVLSPLHSHARQEQSPPSPSQRNPSPKGSEASRMPSPRAAPSQPSPRAQQSEPAMSQPSLVAQQLQPGMPQASPRVQMQPAMMPAPQQRRPAMQPQRPPGAQQPAQRLPPILEGPRPGEYAVTLERPLEGRAKVGLHVKPTKQSQLSVTSVTEGLLQDWNRAHPQQEVRVGYMIMAVNGVRGDSALMLEQIRSALRLVMYVRQVAAGAQQ